MAVYPSTSFFHETLIDHRPLEGYVRTRYATDLYEVTTRVPAAADPARDELLPVAVRLGRVGPAERMREHFLSSGCVWNSTPSGSITITDLL